eukprot:Nk52_evm10s2118 gene=Nk52_evmTU10s2118
MSTVVRVECYNPEWAQAYLGIKDRLWPVVGPYAIGIEHVGSTSVPGLAAKPVIDIDIVFSGKSEDLEEIKQGLEKIGYAYNGDQGIPERFAFKYTGSTPIMRHNLYACVDGCLALRNHIMIRDHLRENEADREAYGALKQQLVEKYSDDINAYCENKTDFLVDVLSRCGLSDEERREITGVNVNTS